jgi:hypothetical protein
VVIAQQNALSEQRARLARGNHMDDDYHNLSDEYKGSAFGGNDAKKRRGVCFEHLSSDLFVLTIFLRRRPLQGDVTVAIEQKHLNGGEDLMVPGPYVMHVVYITPN